VSSGGFIFLIFVGRSNGWCGSKYQLVHWDGTAQAAYLLSSLTLAACFILDSLTLCRKASWSSFALEAGAIGAVPVFPPSSALEGPDGGSLAGVGGARGVYHQPSSNGTERTYGCIILMLEVWPDGDPLLELDHVRFTSLF
jgi:hypothetical protein